MSGFKRKKHPLYRLKKGMDPRFAVMEDEFFAPIARGKDFQYFPLENGKKIPPGAGEILFGGIFRIPE